MTTPNIMTTYPDYRRSFFTYSEQVDHDQYALMIRGPANFPGVDISVIEYLKRLIATCNARLLSDTFRSKDIHMGAIEASWVLNEHRKTGAIIHSEYPRMELESMMRGLPMDDELTLDQLVAVSNFNTTQHRHIPRSARIQAIQRSGTFENCTGYGLYLNDNNGLNIAQVLIDAKQMQRLISDGLYPQFASFYWHGFRSQLYAPSGITLVAQGPVSDIRTGEVYNLTGVRLFMLWETYGQLHPQCTDMYYTGLMALGHLPESLREQLYIDIKGMQSMNLRLKIAGKLHLVYQVGEQTAFDARVAEILETFDSYEQHIVPILNGIDVKNGRAPATIQTF